MRTQRAKLPHSIKDYIEEADMINALRKSHGFSHRDIVSKLGISKGSVSRMLNIAALPNSLKKAAVIFNVEKYVLVEYCKLSKKPEVQKHMRMRIKSGRIQTRKRFLLELAKYEREQKIEIKKLPTLPLFLESV
jgi:transcriptional regulator with XRE-family HTH domain